MLKNKNKFDLRNSKYLFGFSLVPEITPARFEKINKEFQTIQAAWQSSEIKLASIFGKKVANKIYQKKSKINLVEEIGILKEEQIKIISPKFSFEDFPGINSKFFPEKLAQIPHPPFILFAKGNLKLINKNQLGIVGSRRPTYYGKQILEKLGSEIARSGLIITSGMAMGIDTLAHRESLRNNQPTIAVLGNGLGEKILKKSSNYSLGKEILEKNGLLVSEYPPLYPANKFTFPARNRIISGLSLGVLVIEAAERSGTLITARHALEQNREVLAVPGNIFSPQSVGTNKLIKQGAALINSVKDIFQTLNWKVTSENYSDHENKPEFEDDLERLIYQKLSFDPEPLDKLVIKCNLDISTISIKLSIMELKGTVKNIQGGYIRN